ncbi:uncharacterized protein E0L32_003960 [Thyridium curvatum]|uniref:Glucose-methanol-choline oxidoreductase N-terminal domain-containing protein n=1 Tax=Thyridium curvatum TaxID=1093900 RepID=A0A507BH32_9PEZI|nr:uncharacterized protein E0L32_003960 [Thyridium curvatum]TPX16311.1 hypothetical protein E0L32_003960 [Thyridium curvatum]
MTAAPTTESSSPETFDYIVVGGGTAGLVVASRLSEDPEVTILVIEAGQDNTNDPLVLTPGLLPALFGNDKYDWDFHSTPQPTLHNRTIPRGGGKMLGGSSALNLMLVAWPGRGSIDAWGALGNNGWTYDSFEPYLRKFARTHEPADAAREVARVKDGQYDPSVSEAESGPIQLSFGSGYNTTNTAWADAFANLGLKMSSDPRKGTAVGAFQSPASIDPATKTRSYAASGYLTPEIRDRSNLVVMTETLVSRIIFDTSGQAEPVATGVKIRTKDGSERAINARTEVIMAAGALQTPQILELSGIGDKSLLEKHGISVIVDNPNVGEHLQDHPSVLISFEVADGVPSADIFRDPSLLQGAIAQYQETREGPMGQSVLTCAYAPLVDREGSLSAEARKTLFDEHLPASAPTNQSNTAVAARHAEHELLRSLLTKPDEPGVQYILYPTQAIIAPHPKSLGELMIPREPENFVSVQCVLNYPFSRGSCHIASPDVADKPVWDPNYNAEAADLEILARGLRFVETLVRTQPFAGLLREGGKRVPDMRADDLEGAREIVRQYQVSEQHPTSSCAMLPRELGGVVDSRLRVYGVRGLRVVDASVFPLEQLGNIQTTVYAVAERAADFIKQDRKGA